MNLIITTIALAIIPQSPSVAPIHITQGHGSALPKSYWCESVNKIILVMAWCEAANPYIAAVFTVSTTYCILSNGICLLGVC